MTALGRFPIFTLGCCSLFLVVRLSYAQALPPLEAYPGDGVRVVAEIEMPEHTGRLRLVVGRFIRARNGKNRYLSVVTPGWGKKRKLLAGQWLENGRILEAIDMGSNRCLILQSVPEVNATRIITVEVKSLRGEVAIETSTSILQRGIEAAALNARQGVVFGYDCFANEFVALPLSGGLHPSSVLVCRSDLGLRNRIKRQAGRDLVTRRLTISAPVDSPASFVCDVDRAGLRERVSVDWDRGELVALASARSEPLGPSLYVSPRGAGRDGDGKPWAAESSTLVDLEGPAEILNRKGEAVWRYSGQPGPVDLSRVLAGRAGARETYRLVHRGEGEDQTIVARLPYGRSFTTAPGVAEVVPPGDLTFLFAERPTVRPVVFVHPEVNVEDLEVYLLWGMRTPSGEDRLLRFDVNGTQLPLVDPVCVTKCDALQVDSGGRLAKTLWQAESLVPSGLVSAVVLQQVLIVSKSGRGSAASAVSVAVIGDSLQGGVFEMRLPEQWVQQPLAYREKAHEVLSSWFAGHSQSLSPAQRQELLERVGK